MNVKWSQANAPLSIDGTFLTFIVLIDWMLFMSYRDYFFDLQMMKKIWKYIL